MTLPEKPQRNYETILFTPEQIGANGSAYLKRRREDAGMGMRVGLKSLDVEDQQGNIFLPVMPGEMVGIIARPGHGKTSWMVRWARYRANEIKGSSKVVVYVTLEQSVEELNAFNVAAEKRFSITSMAKGEISDEEWVECLKEAVDRRFIPLWNIGYSSVTEQKQVRIDIDSIAGALALIKDKYGKDIDSVFVDYLQRIPYDRAESKTIGISDNLDALKTLTLSLKTRSVVGVQARREVDESEDKIPHEDDGQWSSNIEQTFDKLISIMRPRKYFAEGEVHLDMLIQGNAQMLVSVLKQKLGPANFTRWVYFDPVYNKLDELEIINAKRRLP